MKITKKSMITGDTHTLDINVTEEQLRAWQGGMLIQQAMPNLTPDEREFIMTGITPEEWNNTFTEGSNPDAPPKDHGKELP